MSDSESPAIPPNLDSHRTSRSGDVSSSHGESPPGARPSDGIANAAALAASRSGKRKLSEGGFSNGMKLTRMDSPSSSVASDTNEISSEVDEDMIGQPKLAYSITAPLVKSKPTPTVRTPEMLVEHQSLPVPRSMPGMTTGLVSGMIPALPLHMGGVPGVGKVPMLGPFGGAAASPLNMATLANLQALQMNQLLKAFMLPAINNNLGKLLSNEQMAFLAAASQMNKSVTPLQTPLLHPPRPLLSASSSATTTTGIPLNRSLQENNYTSTPAGTFRILDDALRRQTVESGGNVERTTTGNRDDSLIIDSNHHHQDGVTTDNSSSDSDEVRFRVSDAESSGNGGGGREAIPPNGHLPPPPPIQQPPPQDLCSYQERRRKNNDSARRSRDARRSRIDETAKRVAFLEMENLQMRAVIEAEREYLARMHRDLMQRKGEAWNNPTQFAALQQMLDNVSATNAARFYSLGQQVAASNHKSSVAAVKQELTNDFETQQLDCDVQPS